MSAGITSVKQQLNSNPNSVEALSEAALYYVSRADFKAATKYYQKLTRLDSNNCKAWTALGHCYLLMKEYQRCFQAYERVLLSQPESLDSQLWYGIALLYYKFEKHDLALKAFEKLTAIAPDFIHAPEVLFKLGNICKAQLNYEDAIQNYKKSLTYDVPLPRKIDTLCKMGVCLLKSDRDREAQECFMKALAFGPSNFKTLEFMGWSCLCVKNYTRAIEYFKSAEASAEENQAEIGDLNYLIGLCYYDTGLFTECDEAWNIAMSKNPTSHIYHCSAGVLAMRLEQIEVGVAHFKKALEIKQNFSEVLFNLGVYYESIGKCKEAMSSYAKASEQGDSQARESLVYLKRNGTPRTTQEYKHPTIDISDHPFSIVLPENPLQPHHLPDIEILIEPPQLPKPKISNSQPLPKPDSLPQLPPLPKHMLELKEDEPKEEMQVQVQVHQPPPQQMMPGMQSSIDPMAMYQYMMYTQYFMNYPRNF
mmetsp:Transcript_9649/g.18816  ORF Transcript_9649/g.18816 Transcript_9649/m.18816 type:complete len:478 (-) Transcript_9649:690-2123(-)